MNSIVKKVNCADVQKFISSLSENDKVTLALSVIVGVVYLGDKAINTIEKLASKTIDNKGSVSIGKNGINFTPAGVATT